VASGTGDRERRVVEQVGHRGSLSRRLRGLADHLNPSWAPTIRSGQRPQINGEQSDCGVAHAAGPLKCEQGETS
jgi:hypothetical protein